MPSSYRKCPVCGDYGVIGYGKKTCSSECGRNWVKMSKAEQKVRMADSLLTPEERADRLRAEMTKGSQQFVDDYSENDEPPPRRPDPSLHMPKGILGEEPQPALSLNITKDAGESADKVVPLRIDPSLLKVKE